MRELSSAPSPQVFERKYGALSADRSGGANRQALTLRIWIDAGGLEQRFELARVADIQCSGEGRTSHALVWIDEEGLAHVGVDRSLRRARGDRAPSAARRARVAIEQLGLLGRVHFEQNQRQFRGHVVIGSGPALDRSAQRARAAAH